MDLDNIARTLEQASDLFDNTMGPMVDFDEYEDELQEVVEDFGKSETNQTDEGGK